MPTDSPGFSYQLLDKIGNKGSDTGLLFFEDVRVPVSNTIGDTNRGFQQQMMQFQDERMVGWSPHRRRAQLWQETRKWPAAHAFGKPLSKMQVTQHKFVDMMIQITAAQELCLRCIRKMSRNEDATLRHLHGQGLLHDDEPVRGDTCVQLFGGAGYMYENPAGRAFVDSRLARIGGGADEVMKQEVAKMLRF